MEYFPFVNIYFGIFSNYLVPLKTRCYMDILERVKDLCYRQGLTVAELERKADLGNGSVRRWNTSIPAADKLQRAAIILGTSMDYLLTGKEPSEDSETLLLARDANSLTKEQLQVVKNVIDEFKKTNNIG